MNIFSPISTDFAGWVGIVGLGLAALFVLFSRVRKADMELLRDSNDDLRKAIDDKGREIEQMHKEITTLQGEVKILKDHNKTLEDLVITALKQYFFENPKVAGKLKDVIK